MSPPRWGISTAFSGPQLWLTEYWRTRQTPRPPRRPRVFLASSCPPQIPTSGRASLHGLGAKSRLAASCCRYLGLETMARLASNLWAPRRLLSKAAWEYQPIRSTHEYLDRQPSCSKVGHRLRAPSPVWQVQESDPRQDARD